MSKGLFLLALLALASACVRAGFDASSLDGSAADGPAPDGALLDGQGDATFPPDAFSDSMLTDTGVDSSASRRLSGDPARAVGSNQPAGGIIEPAITPDGLMLIARRTGTFSFYATTRSDLDAPFGSWSSYSNAATTGNGKQDPTFFEHQGGLHAMLAIRVDPLPRTLHHCDPGAGTCEQITIYDSNGVALDSELDLDGPSVASNLEMLINVSGSGSLAAIYRATPRDASLLEWDAEPFLVSPPPGELDDAAISADGSLVVVSYGSVTPTRMVYSFFTEDGTYGPLQELSVVPESPGSVEVYLRPDGDYELFFAGGGATPTLYHKRCR